MAQPARQISKGKLLQLAKAADACNSRMAEERGALGAKFEAAATADNFNAKAFRMLRPLLKMEPGPQAHLWRTLLLYAAHFDIGTQGDLEDVIASDEAQDGEETDGAEDAQADLENAAEARALADEDQDGQAEVDPVESVLAGMDVPEIGRFRSAIAEAGTIEAVNLGLERFTENNPHLAEEALAVAQSRLEAINAELGGGEDLRSTAAQDAEAGTLAENAEAAEAGAPVKGKGKRAGKAKARPSSPATEAARAMGVGGDDFGKAAPKAAASVH